MNRELLDAIQNGKPWLDRFTRPDYPKAFTEYSRRFGPLYRAAIDEAGDRPEGLAALAAELVDTLTAERTGERFWNRSVRAMDEKRIVVCYLSPMLLEQGNGAFADLLRDAWAAHWPRDAYQFTTYDKLRSSFRNAILGFEVRGREEE